MKKPWAGRFSDKTHASLERFSCSVHFDSRLWEYDIKGSIAHVKMLAKQKIISRKDADRIIKGLKEIRDEIKEGKFQFKEELEDVHMNIEHALIEKMGPVGGKVHTARSRNDQIALDVRLYLRDEIETIQGMLATLQKALLKKAEECIDIIMPGYTHLQRAQPVLLSHHLLAYCEMLQRDRERLEDCLKRVDVLPLGSAALAGTGFNIDREYVAKLLDFKSISSNSMDAVSDRDFVIEFISTASMIMMHLSRFSEEMILWNTEEFGFVELPDAFTTGSSIMPQKKNPDVFELIRGKTGRVYGNLISILTVMKALPLTYNRDMQEDKGPLFDTVDTLKECLKILKEVIPHIKFKREKMRTAVSEGFMTATDLADYLVKKGVPFREAHHITGRIVSYCIKTKKSLHDLAPDEFRKFSTHIEEDVYEYLLPEKSIDSRRSYGGTSSDSVMEQIKRMKKILGMFLLIILLISCGRRGDPFLSSPPIKEPQPPKETVIRETRGTNEITHESNIPPAPNGLRGIYTGQSVILTWNEIVREKGLTLYRIYRSEGKEYTLVGNSMTPAFTDNNVVGGRVYYYRVSAEWDAEGLLSESILIKTE